jgi:hypothetical protein
LRILASSAFLAMILAVALGTMFPASTELTSPCSSLVVQTDKQDYTIGEPVNITVNFLSHLAGCMIPMVARDYVVEIEVLDMSNQTLYSVSHSTVGTLMASDTWIPSMVGDYTITASAYFRFLGYQTGTKTNEVSTTIRVYDPAQQVPEFGLVAVGVIGVVVVALGSLLLSRMRGLRKTA